MSKYKFNKFHAVAMVVVFVGLGYVLIRTFAATPCAEVCVILPEGDSVKSEDFHIRTRVTARVDRSEFNVKVILDQGKPHEQVVDIRKRSSTLKTGTTVDYNFYFGSIASGTNDTLVFDRNLLTPGQHTVTAEMRTGDTPAQGTLISSHRSTIVVTNVKNLMSSIDVPKTFYTKYMPLSGAVTPRIADASSAEPKPSGIKAPSLAGAINSLNPEGTASAHTETGARHGHLYVTAYRKIGDNPHAERLPNVGIHLDRDCDGPVYVGTSRDAVTRNTGAGTADNGTAYFTNCPVDRTTNVGNYNVSVTSIPSGYHMADVRNKSVAIRWAGEVDRSEITFILERDSVSTSCPRGPVRRLVNTGFATGQDHFYTMAPDKPFSEYGFPNGAYGYYNELAAAWHAYTYPANSTLPFYRMFHPDPSVQNHFYTTSETERANVKRFGWVDDVNFDGSPLIEGYISPGYQSGTVPLYRSSNASTHDFLYTTHAPEYEGAKGAGYYPWPDPNGNPVIGYVWNDTGCITTTTPTTEPVTTTANYTYTPINAPVFSMTSLSASTATLDAFSGVGMDANGYPGVKTLASVTARVDGVVRDTHSLAGRSNNTLIGEVVQLGNISDGRYHTVEISVASITGASSTMKFYVNPYDAPTGVLGYMVSYREQGTVEYLSATSNRGAVKIQTYENSNENEAGDTTLLDRKIGNVDVYAENYKSAYHCGDKPKTTSYKTSKSTGAYTFAACPVGNVGPSYKKSYYIYSKIPAGYHVDSRFLRENDIKLVPLPGTSEIGARRKVSLYKDKTRTYSFVFAKNQARAPAPVAPASATTVGPVAPDASYDATHENYMIELVNSERTSRGIPALTVNPDLTQIARMYVYQENTYNFFAHVGFNGDATCNTVYQRGKAARDDFSMYGENLAYLGDPWAMMYGAQYPEKFNPNSDPALFDSYHGYMNSPAHRANILERSYLFIGIGTLSSPSYAPNEVVWTAGDPGLGEAEGACKKVNDAPRQPGNFKINAMQFAGEKI